MVMPRRLAKLLLAMDVDCRPNLTASQDSPEMSEDKEAPLSCKFMYLKDILYPYRFICPPDALDFNYDAM
jgi:hypothetical protein